MISTKTASAAENGIRIVGQGLCGSLLALALEERGIPFIVQDKPLPGEASAVAPGIVNPLAGRKLKPPENIKDLLASLHRSRERLRRLFDSDFWHPSPILRLFFDDPQIERYREMLAGPGSRFVEERFPENHFPFLNDHFGSFLTREGGWMDLPEMKAAVRRWLSETGRLEETVADPGVAEPDGRLRVFCEGWRFADNPLWKWLPHNPARGEMLIIEFGSELPRDRIFNQNCWAQPLPDGKWRVGATYAWDDFTGAPSVRAAEDLQERLRLLTPVPFTVKDQVAGVRPILEDYKPVLGIHPEHPAEAVVNAMGSKGVLQTPFAVEAFAAHLFDGREPPPAWAIDRFR